MSGVTIRYSLEQAINEEGANGPTVTSSATQSTFGTYVQIVASLAHLVRAFRIVITSSSVFAGRLGLATGGSGSEANQHVVRFNINSANAVSAYWFPVDASLFPKAARLSIAITNDGAASATAANITVDALEDNS